VFTEKNMTGDILNLTFLRQNSSNWSVKDALERSSTSTSTSIPRSGSTVGVENPRFRGVSKRTYVGPRCHVNSIMHQYGIQGSLVYWSAMRQVDRKRDIVMVRRKTNSWGEEKLFKDEDFDPLMYHATTEGGRRLVFLTQYQGNGRMYIVDPSLRREKCYTGFYIELDNVGLLAPLTYDLRGFQLIDVTGTQHGNFSLVPDGMSDYDCMLSTINWIRYINPYCTPTSRTVGILRYGFLEKKGIINSAFRKRLFLLSSDGQMKYFKPESCAPQGKIDLEGIHKIEWLDPRQGSSLFSKIALQMQTQFRLTDQTARIWILSSPSKKDAKSWIDFIDIVAKGGDIDDDEGDAENIELKKIEKITRGKIRANARRKSSLVVA